MAINPIIKNSIYEDFIDPKERIAVENCITRYAKPSGFCDTLKWICFRTFNIFLSIFGRSDWQKTVRLYERSITQKTIASLENDPSNKQKELITNYAKACAKTILNAYLDGQNKKFDGNQLDGKLNELDPLSQGFQNSLATVY